MAFEAIEGETEFRLTRNGFDEFIEDCKEAAFLSVKEMVDIAEPRAKAYAPKRSGALAASVDSAMRSRTEGEVSADRRYAKAQELGARPHTIRGFLRFFWENRGRMFVWNNPRYNNWDETGVTVNHPGNQAHPYIRPALRYAVSQWRRILPKHYPN